MPGEIGSKMKRPISRPSLRWSRWRASSTSFRCSSSASLVGERGAVDSREHRVVLVAAPVRAGDAGQLERLQVARSRARAVRGKDPSSRPGCRWKSDPRPRLIISTLYFSPIAREFRDGFLARDFGPRDLVVGLRQLAHLRFDLRQILDRERRRGREVVEEAVLDDRTDRHLRAGIERLHRHRHQMRGRVTDYVEAFGRLGQHRLDRRVVIELARQIDDLAVDARGDEVAARDVLQHVANDSANRHDAGLAAKGYGYVGTHQAKNLIIAGNGGVKT